jgi:hypothetical protein
MVRRTGFRVQDSGFRALDSEVRGQKSGVRIRKSSFALALLCIFLLVTRHCTLPSSLRPDRARCSRPLTPST